MLTVYDIKKGNFNIINQNSEIIFIYDLLILWLIPLIDRNQLNFLNNNICEFKLFQWIILNRIIDSKILKETEPKDQIILNHLIESITNVDIFVQLGNNKTIALLILNKLKIIYMILKLKNFYHTFYIELVVKLNLFLI